MMLMLHAGAIPMRSQDRGDGFDLLHAQDHRLADLAQGFGLRALAGGTSSTKPTWPSLTTRPWIMFCCTTVRPAHRIDHLVERLENIVA